MIPFGNSWLSPSTILNSALSRAPVTIPKNSELYTSLEMSASEMATSDGTRAHAVFFTGM